MPRTVRIVAVGLAFLAALGAAPIAAGGELKTYDFQLVGGRLAGEENTIRVVEGDTVVLVWTADRSAEVHLHGYDLLLRLTPEEPGEMRFMADTPGRFPVESHGHGSGHRAVLYVEVHPE